MTDETKALNKTLTNIALIRINSAIDSLRYCPDCEAMALVEDALETLRAARRVIEGGNQ